MKRRWTDYETDILIRNYPKYGTDQSLWDDKINRGPDAIRRKANIIGLKCVSWSKSTLKPNDRRNLKIIIKRLSETLGITEKNLSREIALIVNEEK